VWLRVADPSWKDPLDPSFAGERGGRWNPPGSFPTLYLNGDPPTALLQIHRMLRGTPVRVDDLDEDAFVLVAATLPRGQTAADGVSEAGLRALGLPATYPRAADGSRVEVETCRPIGAAIRQRGLRGLWCRSAVPDEEEADPGEGRELAWFPAGRRSVARAVWDAPLPLGQWRHAAGWAELGLPEQRDPVP
jgi:hypothetical protein